MYLGYILPVPRSCSLRSIALTGNRLISCCIRFRWLIILGKLWKTNRIHLTQFGMLRNVTGNFRWLDVFKVLKPCHYNDCINTFAVFPDYINFYLHKPFSLVINRSSQGIRVYSLICTMYRELIVILQNICWVFFGNIQFKIPCAQNSGLKMSICMNVAVVLLTQN